jgi:hypothetical protein
LQALATDLRWKVAAGLAITDPGFHPTVLTLWRNKLRANDALAVLDAVDGVDLDDDRQQLVGLLLDLEAVEQDGEWTGIPLDARVRRGHRQHQQPHPRAVPVPTRQGGCTWHDLVAEVNGEDAPWRRDLDRAFTEGCAHICGNPRRTHWKPGGPAAVVAARTSRCCTRSTGAWRMIGRRVEVDRPVRATVLLLPV